MSVLDIVRLVDGGTIDDPSIRRETYRYESRGQRTVQIDCLSVPLGFEGDADRGTGAMPDYERVS